MIAFAFAGADRTRVLRAGLYTAASYLIVAAAILVPYLLPAIRHAPADPVHPLDRTSVDLLGFIVPRTDMLIGGRSFGDFTDRFTANVYEDASYVGIALVVMLAGFAVTERRRRGQPGRC